MLSKNKNWVAIVVLASIVLISKILLIGHYGNGTPYLDQWDAEAAFLYKPWLEGTLTWREILAPHNEHRILSTRLLALILLVVKGYWDPILQMQVNAFIHTFSIIILLGYLAEDFEFNNLLLFASFAVALNVIPFGWENTLAGFQSQFYILLVCTFIFMWAMANYSSYSKGWFYGYFAGIVATFTLASGAITLIAGGILLLIRRYLFKEKNSVTLTAIMLVFGLGLISIYMTPSIPGHAPLKADNLYSLIRAAGDVLAWPFLNYGLGLLFVHIPLFVLVAHTLFKNKSPTPAVVFALGISIWLCGQILSIAYGRATSPLASRYLDIFSIGLILNAFAVLKLIEITSTSLKKRCIFLGSIWIFLISIGLYLTSSKLINELSYKHKTSIAQENNVRSYLCSNDPSHLQNKPHQHIPYPNAERLQSLLDDASIRKILPGNINELNAINKIGVDGEPFCNTGSKNNAFQIVDLRLVSSSEEVASIKKILYSDWRGADYDKSVISGYKIIGSLMQSELETGKITLKLNRGDRILYISGPRNEGQKVIFNVNGEVNFNTQLPLAINWVVLEFSNSELPDEFTVSFIDAGTRWGEWSAIGLRDY